MILVNLFLGLISYTFDRVIDESKGKEGRKEAVGSPVVVDIQNGGTEDSGLNRIQNEEGKDKSSKRSSNIKVDEKEESNRRRSVMNGDSIIHPIHQEKKLVELDASLDNNQQPELSNLELLEAPQQDGTQSARGDSNRSVTNEPGKRSNMTYNDRDLDDLISEEKEPIKTVFIIMKNGGLRAFLSRIAINKYFSILRIVVILLNSVILGLVK